MLRILLNHASTTEDTVSRLMFLQIRSRPAVYSVLEYDFPKITGRVGHRLTASNCSHKHDMPFPRGVYRSAAWPWPWQIPVYPRMPKDRIAIGPGLIATAETLGQRNLTHPPAAMELSISS